MRLPQIIDYLYLCFWLAVFFESVVAGISKGPGPSRVRTSTTPTPTPSVALCKKNPVQCCNSTAESNSTTAVSILEKLGIEIPKKTVEVGFNCTSLSDEEVSGGFCDDSILCCHKIYNDTLQEPVNGVNKTIGVKCSDVGL